MRYLLCLSVILFVFIGCSKKKQEGASNDGLVGKWKLTETYVSPGGGGNWFPYTSDPMIIEFTGSGRFNSTANFPKAALHLDMYTLSGTTVSMSSTLTGNTDQWYIHYLDNNRLDISILMCYEGCAYRFKALGQ